VVASGSVVFDIGANVGYYTLLAAVLVGPRGKVVAAEIDRARSSNDLPGNAQSCSASTVLRCAESCATILQYISGRQLRWQNKSRDFILDVEGIHQKVGLTLMAHGMHGWLDIQHCVGLQELYTFYLLAYSTFLGVLTFLTMMSETHCLFRTTRCPLSTLLISWSIFILRRQNACYGIAFVYSTPMAYYAWLFLTYEP
jgi:hypothetical protein